MREAGGVDRRSRAGGEGETAVGGDATIDTGGRQRPQAGKPLELGDEDGREGDPHHAEDQAAEGGEQEQQRGEAEGRVPPPVQSGHGLPR